MTEPPEVEQPARRRGIAPGWVLGALFLTFVGAFGAAFWIYARYVAFERHAARHLVDGARLAVRVDLEKIVLYAPFREQVLPLVQGPEEDPRLKPRLIRLRQHTGVELGVDVREIVYSRGERPGSWALAVAGMFPKTGVVRGIHEVLTEEGAQSRFDAATERLYLGPSVVVQQAADRVVVFASDPESLASALAPSDRYQALELGLHDPALSVVFVDGRAPGAPQTRLNAALDTDRAETLRLTLQGSTRSSDNSREMAALVGTVTGLGRDAIQFKVTGPRQWGANVPVTSEHLHRAAKHWAAGLRTIAFPER